VLFRSVAEGAAALLEQVDPSPGVRLLGVSVSNLMPGPVRQLALDEARPAGWERATEAVDAVRRRFGDRAVGPAALAGPDGLRVKRRGDQQWGPAGPPPAPPP
jgi:hypothetical protein